MPDTSHIPSPPTHNLERLRAQRVENDEESRRIHVGLRSQLDSVSLTQQLQHRRAEVAELQQALQRRRDEVAALQQELERFWPRTTISTETWLSNAT